MRQIVAIVSAALLAGSAVAAERERKLSLGDIPPELRAAADKAVPGATWHTVKQETDRGRTLYEFEGRAADSRKAVEVELMPDGTLLQTETEIALADVPAVVRDAVKQRWPDLRPDEIKAVTRPDGSLGYEFEEQRRMGKEFEVYVSADGKIVEQRED